MKCVVCCADEFCIPDQQLPGTYQQPTQFEAGHIFPRDCAGGKERQLEYEDDRGPNHDFPASDIYCGELSSSLFLSGPAPVFEAPIIRGKQTDNFKYSLSSQRQVLALPTHPKPCTGPSACLLLPLCWASGRSGCQSPAPQYLTYCAHPFGGLVDEREWSRPGTRLTALRLRRLPGMHFISRQSQARKCAIQSCRNCGRRTVCRDTRVLAEFLHDPTRSWGVQVWRG